MMNEIGITDKYKISFINDKRYYEFDMTEKLPILDNTIPYCFRYKDTLKEQNIRHTLKKLMDSLNYLKKMAIQRNLSIKVFQYMFI